jgi:hypothetical protein
VFVVSIARFVTALQRTTRTDNDLIEEILAAELVPSGLLPWTPREVTWKAWGADPGRGMHLCDETDLGPGHVLAGWTLAVTTAAVPLADREDT